MMAFEGDMDNASQVAVEKIALEFSKLLAASLGAAVMQRIVELNDAETDKGVCHCHDFCDANVLMESAFELCEQPLWDGGQIPESNMKVWNAAWDLAVKNRFDEGELSQLQRTYEGARSSSSIKSGGISDTAIMVTLPSGNKAVYLVHPRHMPRQDVPISYQWPIWYGEQVAVSLNGAWYKPGLKEVIDDLKVIALLERSPEFESPTPELHVLVERPR